MVNLFSKRRSDQHESRGWQPGESRSDRLVRPARICARAPHKAESLTGTPSPLLVPSSVRVCESTAPAGHPSTRPPVTGPGCSQALASRQPVWPAHLPGLPPHRAREGCTHPHYRQGGRDCRPRRLRLAHHLRAGKLEPLGHCPNRQARRLFSTHHRTALHYIASPPANPPARQRKRKMG